MDSTDESFSLNFNSSSDLEEQEIALGALSRLPSPITPEPIAVCKCLTSAESSEGEVQSERKKKVLSTVARTEAYLRERRIPELIRFLLTKIMQRDPKTGLVAYIAGLLDECMIFRAGIGVAPVLFEDRHLEAVVKSFDPGQRGWMSAGQVRRAFITVGLPPPAKLEGRVSTDAVLHCLRVTQERHLLDLLTAGVPGFEKKDEDIVQDNHSN